MATATSSGAAENGGDAERAHDPGARFRDSQQGRDLKETTTEREFRCASKTGKAESGQVRRLIGGEDQPVGAGASDGVRGPGPVIDA